MYRFRITLLIAALAFSGCMRLGPDYQRPEPDFRVPEQFEQATPAQTGDYISQNNQDKWWRDFNDPELDRVVTRVALNNPDIHQATARVMESRAFLTQTRADQYPELNLNANTSRQQQSVLNPATGGRESVTGDSFSLSTPASFELDLWGRLSRATQATRAELMATEENRRAIVQSIIAEAVMRHLEIRSLEQRIAINHRLIDAYRQNLQLVEGRYQRGLTSVLDVRQARRILAQAESRLPGLIESLGRSQQALSILQGAYPEAGEPGTYQAEAFQLLPPVPPGLPSELLIRRPDIRTAEARLMAASERIGVAKANRFPHITLTGSFGYASNSLNALFTPASQLWQIATQGLQPVFNAGKLSAAQRAAEARYQQQLATYAKQVLNAFGEVEGALLTREQQIERRLLLVRFLDEARATLAIAMDRYKRGLIDYLNVLDAQQALFQAELELVESELTIYSNRVRLYRALGGGWDQVTSVEGPAEYN